MDELARPEEKTMGYENCGKHPNSLKQLRPVMDSERAKEMQAKGAETRRQNKAIRESMRITTAEWKKIKDEVLPESLSALDILRIQMHKAIEEGDNDMVIDLAKTIAEFEQPKLQRIDQTSLEVNADNLSDEELQKKIDELSK